MADYAIESEFPPGLAATVLEDCEKILGKVARACSH